MAPLLTINGVLRSSEDGRRYRLLGHWAERGEWVWFRLEGKSELPEWVGERYLETGLEVGRLAPDPGDDAAPASARAPVTDAAREHAKRWWEILEPLVEDPEGALFFPVSRARRIRERARACKVSDRSIYHQTRRYWERGQTPEALLPDYHLRGGRGGEKTSRKVKMGRRRTRSEHAGINATPAVREAVKRALERHLLDGKGRALSSAYREMSRTIFSDETVVLYGREVTRPLEAWERPTYEQFRYHAHQILKEDPLKNLKRWVGRHRYVTRHRPSLHRASPKRHGPLAEVQVDATVADIHLVSALDLETVIGRPVLYLVVDVFSGLILGVHVALAGPNWEGLMCALEHALSEKPAFCAQYGLVVTPEEWPGGLLFEAVVGDGGELVGPKAEWLVKALKIRVSNTAPRRPDWKPEGERAFRTANEQTFEYVPGYVNLRDPKEPGNPQLDAQYTLDGFFELCIHHALQHNRTHVPETPDGIPPGYPQHREGPPTPIEAFDWGRRTCSGQLRSVSQAEARAALLPHGEATVTREGLRFQGLLYGPEKLLERDVAIEEVPLAGWFLRGWASKWRPKKVRLRYDPRSTTVLEVQDPEDLSWHTFRLIKWARELEGLTFQEAGHILEWRRQARRRKKEQLDGARRAHDNLKATVAPAPRPTGKRTRRASPEGGRAARKEERRARAQQEAWIQAASSAEPEAPPSSAPASRRPAKYVPGRRHLDVIRKTREEDSDE